MKSVQSLFEFALDRHADAGLEMRVQAEALEHRDRDGAVGEDGGARLRVEAAGVAHEERLARQLAEDGHRQQGGDVPLAAAVDALGIEDGQAEAAGGVHGVEQIEAAHRYAAKIVFLHEALSFPISSSSSSIGMETKPMPSLSIMALGEYSLAISQSEGLPMQPRFLPRRAALARWALRRERMRAAICSLSPCRISPLPPCLRRKLRISMEAARELLSPLVRM